jgi:hypothetical protein
MRLNADAAVEERRTQCVPQNKPRTTRRREREGQTERCDALRKARRTVSGTGRDLVATIRGLSWLLYERPRPGRTTRQIRSQISAIDLRPRSPRTRGRSRRDVTPLARRVPASAHDRGAGKSSLATETSVFPRVSDSAAEAPRSRPRTVPAVGNLGGERCPLTCSRWGGQDLNLRPTDYESVRGRALASRDVP